MRFKTLAVSAALFAGATFLPELAPAASFPGAQSPNTAAEVETLVDEIKRRGHGHRGHRHHGHRHHGHRHRGHRHHGHNHHRHHRHFRRHYGFGGYGYGGYGYYGGGGYCAAVSYSCAEQWDWGTRPYYYCIRDAGC